MSIRGRKADGVNCMRKNRRIKVLGYIGACVVLLCAGLSGSGSAGADESAKADENAAEGEGTEHDNGAAADDHAPDNGAVTADGTGEDDVSIKADSEEEAGDGVGQSGEEPAAATVSLEGLGISILGDSISTYDGWIPEGFNVFYPFNGDLTDVSQTWWKSLVDETGMELCANNSSSGSTCIGDSLSIDDPSSGCSDGRLSFLAGSQGRLPDVIVVYMGTNDLLKGIPIGDNDGTRLVEDGSIENFSDAYCMILDKLASYYPTAQIFCCTLAPVGDWGKDQPFVVFENHLGLTAGDYSDHIRVIADNKGISVIDLYDCGIEIDNLQEMTTDGTHLTPAGMECVKNAVLDALTAEVVR